MENQFTHKKRQGLNLTFYFFPDSSNSKLSLDSFQFDRISLIRIPLADIEILVAVYADVVAVFEDGLFLEHELQYAFLVFRCSTSGVGYHLVFLVQDGDEAGIGCKVKVPEPGPAYATV